MGLFDRLWDSLFGQNSRDDRASGTCAPPHGGAVALLEAPTNEPAEHRQPNDHPATISPAPARWWAPDGVTTVSPVWMAPMELIGEARALEARLVSHFDGHDLTLPTMPHVAERVLHRLRDPKCSMGNVAQELADDQVAAADVLRLVNAPLYRGAYKVTTLQGAVTRLGTNVLRTLMLHQSLRSITLSKKSGAQDLARIIWCRSLASGSVMRALAPLVELDEEDAFTLGLLHDIGNIIVLRTACEQELVSHHWLDENTFEYLCFETHQEFGELIAEKWQLPETIKSVIASHHAMPSEDDPYGKQRRLILLTDMICQMLGCSPGRVYDLLATEPARQLGLDEHPGTEGVLNTLPDRISETLTHLE